MLAKKKCVRHVEREAVACCPSCSGDFCRECIVEHDGKVLCATCLAREVAGEAPKSAPPREGVLRMLTTAACVLLLWVAFYAFGQFVKVLPPRLHDGSVWNVEAP